ncbi:protein of unknown function [Halopseudomonas formosensis]|uniref:DUF4268 domain-containing protein n=1 Tax=Halopseudomonas formosensis TaxID=1002526 RepID=A0A1I6BR68_9GAMM|nr:DUF4268 domain-containing protein [Halopseudomonas formosensis]SFQ83422.1 protein of unknown function [Halopseudomonas formosensis]
MFKINPTANRISPLEVKRFSDLGFTERKHLQEWLENYPQALTQGDGDELLIIQKEFDGFDDTRERLDLLAIDKEGNLVIIENKLDDSGRDVVWQALKYASYCANLKKQQVVEIFQRYLNQKAQSEGAEPANAERVLLEFLQADDLQSVQLNTLKSQRLILVAAHYRKEVTNTVLWLSQFGVNCQCFKVTPYQAGTELFLNVEQIIPTPEASDFMIGMMAKEDEEKSASNEQRRSHGLRLAFWEQALEAFIQSSCRLFDNISPGRDHWLSAGSGLSGMSFNLIFGKSEIRVEFYMSRPQAETNQLVFDQLFAQKEQIEAAFGAELEWQPLPNRKACRIQYSRAVDGYNKDNWADMIKWLVEHMTRLEAALSAPLGVIRQNLKNQ